MFFVDGQPLRQPTRNAIVRRAERERVRQLVPHRRAPVEWTRVLRRRRIERQRRPEAHTQCAESGESHRAHREIGVAAINLDADRGRRRVAVFSREGFVRLLGEVLQVDREDGRLVLLDHELKVGARDEIVVLICVEQVERVLHPHVVWIAGERRLETLSPVADLSEAHLVHPEHAPRVPVLGIERDALFRELGRGFVQANLRRELGERAVELRILGVQRECALAHRVEPGLIVGEILDRRRDGERVLRRRIHLERAVDVSLRAREILEVQQHLTVQRASLDVLGIDVQRGAKERVASCVPVSLQPPRGAEQRAWIVRIRL